MCTIGRNSWDDRLQFVPAFRKECVLSSFCSLKRCLFLKQVAKSSILKIITIPISVLWVIVQSGIQGIYDYHLYPDFQEVLIYRHPISQCVRHFELWLKSVKTINKLNSSQIQGCFLHSVFMLCTQNVFIHLMLPDISVELVNLPWILEFAFAFHNLKSNLSLALLGYSSDISSMVVKTCKPGTL